MRPTRRARGKSRLLLKAVTLIGVLALSLTPTLIGAHPAGAANPPEIPETSEFFNTNDSWCVNANGNTSGVLETNGDAMQLWSCTGSVGDQFFWDGSNLENIYGLCLDADSSYDGQNFPFSGDILQLWSCNSNAEQQWKLESNGTIQNVDDTSYCIDAKSQEYP